MSPSHRGLASLQEPGSWFTGSRFGSRSPRLLGEPVKVVPGSASFAGWRVDPLCLGSSAKG